MKAKTETQSSNQLTRTERKGEKRPSGDFLSFFHSDILGKLPILSDYIIIHLTVTELELRLFLGILLK